MSNRDLPMMRFYLSLLDPLLIAGSLYLLTWISHEDFNEAYVVLNVIAFFVSSYVFGKIGLHRHGHGKAMQWYVLELAFGWTVIVAVLLFLGFASGLDRCYAPDVIICWFIAAPLTMLLSQLALRMVGTGFQSPKQVRSAVIVGANAPGLRLAGRIDAHGSHAFRLRGWFDDRTDLRRLAGCTLPLLGKMSELAQYVREHKIDTIFISQPISSQPRLRRLLDELQDTTASLYFIPDILSADLLQARFDQIAGVPVMAVCETPYIGLSLLLKRLSDIVLALLIQIVIAPLMLAIAVAIKMSSSGPVLFKQRRYGLHGEEIIVYKFRSMHVCEDGALVPQAQKNDPRVTRLGAFLRRTSLDELPQFINVLQGRMSIVGPRPHAVAHNEMYRKLIKGYMWRHKVRPGITGWAQVHGLRGETETLEKMQARVEFDLEYLRRWSLQLDLWVMLRTLRVIWSRENAQ